MTHSKYECKALGKTVTSYFLHSFDEDENNIGMTKELWNSRFMPLYDLMQNQQDVPVVAESLSQLEQKDFQVNGVFYTVYDSIEEMGNILEAHKNEKMLILNTGHLDVVLNFASKLVREGQRSNDREIKNFIKDRTQGIMIDGEKAADIIDSPSAKKSVFENRAIGGGRHPWQKPGLNF